MEDNKLGIALKTLREKKNLTIIELAIKAGIGKGTVGDIETGKSKSTIKTLEKISKALELDSKDREFLFSAHMPADIRNKLTKRERMQLDEILNSANFYYNDKNVSEEDKKKLHDTLQEIFFDAKAKNKRKK